MTPLWRLESQPFVLHLRQLFDRYGIDCVFDVGANQGQYHDLIRDAVGFSGLIVSFEPVPRYAELLRSRAALDKNWIVIECALGAAAGTADINVAVSPGLSSLLAPRQDVVEGFWRTDSIEGTQSVKVERFDDVFERIRGEHAINNPYLKIDTQGFDLEVLKGAGRALTSIAALQTELSVRPIYQGAPTSVEMQEYLVNTGFDLSGFFVVHEDKSCRVMELDCVAVNRERARNIQ